jgi:tRNA (mo5U34)-methyltransferase
MSFVGPPNPNFKEIFELKIAEGTFDEVFRFKNWRHRIELQPGIFTPGYISEFTWHNAFFPTDFKGKSLLDVGANDGLNSFLAERFGASHVTAIDIYRQLEEVDHQLGWNPYAIELAKRMLDSKVEVQAKSIMEVDQLGRRYDHAIISDVITWLPDMTSGIRKVASICDESIIIRDAFLKDDGGKPVLRYDFPRYHAHYYIPGKTFMTDLLKDCGFETVKFIRMSNSALYDNWVFSFPLARSSRSVKLYLDPWSQAPVGELPKIDQDQCLMKIGERYFLRGKGWVMGKDIELAWIQPRGFAKLLRKLIGERYFQLLKESRASSDSHAYTVIAKR